MRSFADLNRLIGAVPAGVVRRIGEIERAAGQEALLADQLPNLLTGLSHRARVESVTASSAIEGIVVEPGRAGRIISGSVSRLRGRSEEELAGYRDALDYVFSADPGETTVGLILHVHRLLLGRTPAGGGGLKTADNKVVDRRPDGTTTTRFDPVSAVEAELHLAELVDRLGGALVRGEHHRLLLIGLFALDLLVIHPFADGNGRVTRIMTNVQLDQAGFGVGRYVSIEKLVDDTGDAYYDALAASTVGWFADNHDPWPWLGYFVGIVADAYTLFATSVAAERSRGTKQDRVRDYVVHHAPVSFTIGDVRRALPGVSDPTIRVALWALRDAGRIGRVGAGRSARWERLSLAP